MFHVNSSFANQFVTKDSRVYRPESVKEHKRQKYAFSNLEEIKTIEIAPTGFFLKYFLKASIGKGVAPGESDRLVLKLCKSDKQC